MFLTHILQSFIFHLTVSWKRYSSSTPMLNYSNHMTLHFIWFQETFNEFVFPNFIMSSAFFKIKTSIFIRTYFFSIKLLRLTTSRQVSCDCGPYFSSYGMHSLWTPCPTISARNKCQNCSGDAELEWKWNSIKICYKIISIKLRGYGGICR